MAIKLIKSYATRLAPGDAANFLKKNTWEGQRKLDKRWVESLVKKMREGLFRTALLATATYDGQDVLVNGQHCANAIIVSGWSIPAFIEEYACDTKKDVADLFAQFDNTKSGRSQKDINQIFAAAYGVSHLSVGALRLAVDALARMHFHTTKGVTKEQKAQLIGMYPQHVEWLNRMLVNHMKAAKHLTKRAVVAAVMIATWLRDSASATAFWTAVRDGEVLESYDPAFVLREWLKDNIGAGTHVVKKTDRNISAVCIHAWNAFRDGRTTTHLKYYKDHPVPEIK